MENSEHWTPELAKEGTPAPDLIELPGDNLDPEPELDVIDPDQDILNREPKRPISRPAARKPISPTGGAGEIKPPPQKTAPIYREPPPQVYAT